ncbi:hypothetical protein CK203_068808 [Vitis vinifera]|uniref:DUF4283 domain-containing protein n=1 Tax=Vitis vinifera TaxID=29760 RepID=A0A438EXZ4_VITVI|nr:hypothetical protein CK203_068808 [Vitis vinifera]
MVGVGAGAKAGRGEETLPERSATRGERVFSHVGQLRGPDSWAGSVGPSSLKIQAAGPSLSPMGDQFGLRQDPNLGRATVDGLGQLQKGKSSLNQAHEVDNGPLLKIFSPGLTDKNRNAFTENEFINYRVEEIGRRQQVQGASSSNSFYFGRSPEKEGYDHSGMQREGAVIGSGSRNPNVEDRIEKRNGCWDLVEINSVEPLGRKLGWMADQTEPQEGSKEDQLNWEESSLVRFSQFLGFSTEGLEVEILNFLDKIRKRKEKIIGKGFLEASRFERELKRLESSVNYEREAKKKGPMKGRGNQKVVIRSQKVDLFCLQETKVQVMSDEMVRSLGPGRYLDWKVLNAKGTAGGVIICWDKRSLEILGVEEGQFSISCRFRNEGDGAIWVFTGVYGPFSREDREGYGRNLGQSEDCGRSRGAWEETST